MKDDLYKSLGLEKNASPEDIKKAFRRKAVQCHPDKHPGDKSKEEEFKKINDAYMVLSDPEKRKRYDMFGEVDDMPHGGGMPPDMAEMFKSMFNMDIGGGSHGPGGFSFVFMGDEPGQNDPHSHIFERMFGGGGGMGGMNQRKASDIIEIPVELTDIYHGKTRKVEFELLDLCNKCQGTGASDPSAVVKCMTCNGNGTISQQLGPFFVQSAKCPNCGGLGNTIRANKICQGCKGQRTCYTKKAFNLIIPKGIPNKHEIRMEEKGSYDERTRKNKDIVFRFVYNVQEPYSLEQCVENGDVFYNVHYKMPITIEDLLGGFVKKVQIYNEEFTIKSDGYFNPSMSVFIDEKGLPNMQNPKKIGRFIVNFVVEFTDNEKLKKHSETLRKILKRSLPSHDTDTNVITFN
jgi:molecular chaperone DnaJ